ncbi:PQQ-like beta-propeller repeat protein, partial [candidate division KSB1 bacterium]|nr:PQQ-like beta-propeller repeat protein [candidate division KSB1 bacterium]
MIKLLRTLLLMLIGIIIPFTLPAQTPGSLKWTFAVDDAVESSPAIGPDGTIYFGSYDTKLYALNPNGSQKWSFQTDAEIFTSPAIGMDGTIYFGSDDACLYA